MVYFWIVVLLLSSFGREEYLCHTLATKHVNEFTIVVKRSIIQDAFNQQGITDVLLLCLWGVPEEASVFVYNLLTRHNINSRTKRQNLRKCLPGKNVF